MPTHLLWQNGTKVDCKSKIGCTTVYPPSSCVTFHYSDTYPYGRRVTSYYSDKYPFLQVAVGCEVKVSLEQLHSEFSGDPHLSPLLISELL